MVNLQTMKIFRCFVLLCMIGLCAVLHAQTYTTFGIGTNPIGTLHVHSADLLEPDEPILPLSVPVTGNFETVVHISNTHTGKTEQDGFSIIQNNGTITFRQFEQCNLNVLGCNQQGFTLTPLGSFGIGTTNPSEKFHVVGNAFVSKSLIADTSVVSKNIHSKSTFLMGADNQIIALGKAHYDALGHCSSYIGFNAFRGAGENGTWTFKSNTWKNGGVVMLATMSGDLLIANVATDSLVAGSLDCTGVQDDVVLSNVNFKLASDGMLFAKGIKVSVEEYDWPDYVFDKEYKVLPLESIEEYIQSNGHLPGVPSAKEIAENGLDLGEMNKLLLQKIEELTLLVIELNNQIKELKGE